MGLTDRQRDVLEAVADDDGGTSPLAFDGRVVRSLLDRGLLDAPNPRAFWVVITEAGRLALRDSLPGSRQGEG